MKTVALVVFVFALVSSDVHGLAVKEFPSSDGDIAEKPLKKEITFSSGRGRGTNQGQESITISGKEARFDVLGGKTGVKMVLDYGNEKVVFTHPDRKDSCFIDTFDKELQELVPLAKIRKLLEESKGTMEFPTQRYTIKAKEFKETTDKDLSPLSKDLCKNLKPYLVIREQESVKALAVREPARKKREVGWGEVVLIVVVCIILL